MHNVIHAIESSVQAILVSHITDEETYAVITSKFLGHVPLFHFIPGKDDDFLGILLSQSHRHEGITKGTSATSDKDCFIRKHTYLLIILVIIKI